LGRGRGRERRHPQNRHDRGIGIGIVINLGDQVEAVAGGEAGVQVERCPGGGVPRAAPGGGQDGKVTIAVAVPITTTVDQTAAAAAAAASSWLLVSA